jgi:hypothetical protein
MSTPASYANGGHGATALEAGSGVRAVDAPVDKILAVGFRSKGQERKIPLWGENC